VGYSISSLDPALKRAFEPYSPSVRLRLKAIEKLAQAGIQVGCTFMPVIPLLGDDKPHLEETIRAVKDHGGSFIMGGGLTMDSAQADMTLEAFCKVNPSLEHRFRTLYNWEEGGKPHFGPPQEYSSRLGLTIRELCSKHGILDRMPRYILPGPLAVNKRVAERLFLKTYDIELEMGKSYQIWAYRKAAWTVDELTVNIAQLYAEKGLAGLTALPGVGRRIAGQIVGWLKTMPQAINDRKPG
jgi:DNA repair photolyase